MQVTRSRRRLPGMSVTGALVGQAVAAGLLLAAGIALLQADIDWASARTGRLPSSGLKAAFTTPAGVWLTSAIVAALMGLPLAGLLPRLMPAWVRREMLGDAKDVTDLPHNTWPARLSGLVVGRRVSPRTAFIPPLIAVAIFGTAVTLTRPLLASCGAGGCAPMYPTLALLLGFTAEGGAVVLLMKLGECLWVQRLQRACGVWLRYRRQAIGGVLLYIRRPGVTPEAASASLASFVRMRGVPLGLVDASLWIMLHFTLMFLASAASFLFYTWLQLQWRP